MRVRPVFRRNNMTWVIVGLGNPGEEYELSRHNAGRMAVRAFAESAGFSEWKLDAKKTAYIARGAIEKALAVAVLPETYMNRSGAAVAGLVKGTLAAKKLIVVYDDLDLPLGSLKVSFNRSSGGHNGVLSVERAVKTRRFVRIRIGVSPRGATGEAQKPKGEAAVEKFILDFFKPHEHGELKPVLERAGDAIRHIVENGYVSAMNMYNRSS